jgi:hypothetical protein
VRGRGLDSSNGCVNFHNIVAVRGGADADSEVEWEGVHGASVQGRLGGRVEAQNLRGHHRVAEVAEASLPQCPWIKLANDSVLLSQLPFKASLKMTMTRYYNLSVCAFWLCSCYFGFFYSILLLFVKFQVKFFLVLNKNEKKTKVF